jgi:RNA polymerase sigma-70 factor (sigma-E family)
MRGVHIGDRGPKQEAWRIAFDRHFADLLKLAALLDGSRDNAEDFVQEAFVRAAARLETLDEDIVLPYLRRSVVNLWKNSVRRRALERRLMPPYRIDANSDQSALVDDRDRVWAALNRLPTRQRACVVLRYYEDLSEADTAEVLEISLGAVKSHVSRALRKLEGDLRATD